ncbi:MAG: alpha/beta hydrolase family protein [Planctomycetaceae bacterium]
MLVKSKEGEADRRKPILILIRGSMAKPLVKTNGQGGHYPPFPFDARIFLDQYHLVCIGKPGLPLLAAKTDLNRRGEFVDPVTGRLPNKYVKNNYLPYYVARNSKVVEFLLAQDWVDSEKIVVAGHSQGSDIAANMADKVPGITHLIYSSGSPYHSTILDMVQKQRRLDRGKAGARTEKHFEFWESVVRSPFAAAQQHGWDTNNTIFSFSQSQNEILKRVRIPVLVTYGTEDTVAPFNDMFRIETIRDRTKDITFKAYHGTEHNYFGVTDEGELDFDKFGWDNVGRDWLTWLEEAPSGSRKPER